jgi:cytochrome c biogenesis protein
MPVTENPIPPAPAEQTPRPVPPAGKQSGPLQRAVDFLSSVPLALFLLIALAATSIFGTLIVQQRGQQEYLQRFGEGMTSFIRFLVLDDMYHSWWFLLLLFLLLLNITLCSAKRFPRSWRQMTDPPPPLADDLFRRLKYRASLRHGGDGAAALAMAEKAVARFGRPRRLTDGKGTTVTADRGWYGRLGVYITHLSILLLAVGVVVGGLTGYRGDVNLLEGQSTDRVPLRGRNTAVLLPFQVRCDRFTIEFYDNGSPKSYLSDLTVIEDGREVLKKRIRVNDPLRYREWSFFQSNYGTDPSSTVTLEVLDQGGRVVLPDITVKAGDQVAVPNDPSQYVVGSLAPNAPGIGGAMVEFHRYLGSEHSDFAVIAANPAYDKERRGPVYFRIKSAAIRQYTGLDIGKDPGVPVVWFSWIVVMAGLYVTFFVAHQRVWVRVDDDPASQALLVAGTTSRNPAVFEKEFEGLVGEIRKGLKER